MVLFIMSYIQLVSPNLSVAGVPDYCLAYVQTVFGAPAVNDTAWHAWEAAQFKHEDRNLPSVAVPIWCAWSGTVEGVFSNYGHVAVWTGTEVYTNPLSGSGHKVFPSIEAMETAYGVQYVGWSEDIETLRVVKGDNMDLQADRDQYAEDWARLRYVAAGLDPGKITQADREDRLGLPWTQANADLDRDLPIPPGSSPFELQAKVDSLTSANLKLTDQLKTQSTPAPTDPNSVVVTQTGLWAAFKRFLGL